MIRVRVMANPILTLAALAPTLALIRNQARGLGGLMVRLRDGGICLLSELRLLQGDDLASLGMQAEEMAPPKP